MSRLLTQTYFAVASSRSVPCTSPDGMQSAPGNCWWGSWSLSVEARRELRLDHRIGFPYQHGTGSTSVKGSRVRPSKRLKDGD